MTGVRNHKKYSTIMENCKGNTSDGKTQENTVSDKNFSDPTGGRMPKEVIEKHEVNKTTAAVESSDETYKKRKPGDESRSFLYLPLDLFLIEN